MTCGIYILEFDDENYYVGCSKNIENRTQHHLAYLKRNTHPNYKVANAFNILKKLPEISILEICLEDELYLKEIWWIKELKATESLNIHIGGSIPPVQFGKDNCNIKLTDDDVLNIAIELTTTKISLEDISKKYNVVLSTIQSIVSGKTHVKVFQVYPELWYKLKNRKNAVHYNNSVVGRQGEPYKVMSPIGELHLIDHITNFCIIHKLDRSALHRTIIGKQKHHFGWTKYNG